MHLPRRCSFQLGEVKHEMGEKKQRRLGCNELPVGSDICSHVLTVGSRGRRGKKRKTSTYAASCGSVPVQGPEICFPKHASCDFTQHCLAQHPASCFLEIFMWEKDKPRTLSPSRFALFRLVFFFFWCSPSAILVDSDHVDPQSARTMTQDLRMLDFDFVPVFFTQMPTRWTRLTEWKSPLVVIR